MRFFSKFATYAFTFMLGYYIGSGGCINRLLDNNLENPSRLEKIVQVSNRAHHEYPSNNLAYVIGSNLEKYNTKEAE